MIRVEALVDGVGTYWQWSERPFEGVSDSRFFFESEGHREALARLGYLVRQESMLLGMLTGEVGCGKTTTLNRFAGEIQSESCVALVFENSFLSAEAILGRVLTQFGLGGYLEGADFSARYDLLDQAVRQLRSDYDRHLCLLFDEAQDMDAQTLARICKLTNLNRDGGRHLSVILIGQPDLRERISGERALDQRVSLRFHLDRIRDEEVGPYLTYRLGVAGAPQGLFDGEAEEEIARCSRGIPREINRLAKLSLEEAAARRAVCVEADDVRTVMRDLRRHQPGLPAVTATQGGR